MTMRIKAFLLFILVGITSLSAQINSEELAKWEARKYSMFIHWGIYSELGGVWNGKNITYGLSEQIQAHAGIYSDKYAEVAKRFNPEKWNAEEIVLLAKKAGMKSIVITSKHHDGFCMYHSQYTNFNIVDATPYKRDILKELSEACAKHGLKMGLYYSLIDWHYPQAMPISSHNSDRITPEHFEFNKKQIAELLTNYGEISELWFDMGSHTYNQSVELRDWVRNLQPDCMVGGRIGNGMGDFMVMGDNQEPEYIIGVPWQSPASFFDVTWGYRSWQERASEADKFREKLTSLINVCGRGGNFLMNIGPRGDGSVVEFEENVLLEIGKWLEKNGEAIYNTYADPFHMAFEWGAITSTDTDIYLHILNMPQDRKIVLPNLIGDISSASVLGEKKMSCKVAKSEKGIVIQLPTTMKPDLVNVVKLNFKKGYSVRPINVVSADEILSQKNAFKYFSHSGVDYNAIYQSTIKEEWNLLPTKTEKRTPVLTYSAQEEGKTIVLNLDGKQQDVWLDVGSHRVRSERDIKMGPIWQCGPMWSSLSYLPKAGIKDIEPTKDWGDNKWVVTEYKNNQVYPLSGDLLTGYFFMQEITVSDDEELVISVTSRDGVIIALNGEVLVNHGNLLDKEVVEDIVLLNLKKGENQLFVKQFANFGEDFSFSINTNVKQKMYRLELPEVEFKANKYFPVWWKNKNPISIHETLNNPNLKLEFK